MQYGILIDILIIRPRFSEDQFLQYYAHKPYALLKIQLKQIFANVLLYHYVKTETSFIEIIN